MKPSAATTPDKTAKLATWNAYHDMAEVLCIEDGGEWREMTVADLQAIITESVKEALS